MSVIGLAALLWACDDKDDDDDDTGSGDEGGGSSPSQDDCQPYLDCIAAVSPTETAAAVQAYGEESTCWDTPDSAATCVEACTTAYDALADAYPEEEACGGAGAFAAAVDWSGDGVTLTLTGGSGDYYFGMAETGAGEGGWYGEDCLFGDFTGTYQYCHPVGSTGATLTSVTTLDLVEGEETVFSEEIAGNITYYVESADGSACWVWGDDPSYYSGLGCTTL